MGYSQRRTFCCCIPTRLGVLILSTLTLLASIVNAYASFLPIANNSKNPHDWLTAYNNLPSSSRTVLIVNGSVAVITGLCALAGLIGAIIRQRRLVGLYSFAVWVLLLANIVLGSISIWLSFRDRDGIVAKCQGEVREKTDNVTEKWDEKACSGAYRVALGVTCAIFAVICLIQMYLCVIVGRYKHQLEAEHANRVPTSHHSRGTYEPVHDVEKNASSRTSRGQLNAASYAGAYDGHHAGPYADPHAGSYGGHHAGPDI
ncbi:unnamed protein product [Tilletia laevis]|uniref:Uncharacterized protein n=3 Tax=Tilletia TaxID=13289 RepID=A0A8X7MQT1_9BASI|nr:hypothetical protein CF328_g4574 [Tilletia controversa]KAE8197965.1 hypothetical protein CF336_g1920 [Tilletia laevis]KAE8260348.1 hypothetical protein A4X03_0g3842 [Tilletia caries]KAE8199336.1 hypothetical protein CF335_g4197 [Tilletia laevis]KAE8245866.1 hypothetical protein A4X06_0g5365 [Tilletia controversa]